MWKPIILAILCALILTSAEVPDTRLAALKTTLLPFRKLDPEHVLDTRGGTPALTTAKHQLRDWIESRLPTDDPAAWPLNQELKRAGLFCAADLANKECDWGSPLGYLGPIVIKQERSHIIVQTAVGIICGFDESAYIYEWKAGHWVRRWQYERNDYAPGKYVPETLHAVLLGPTFKNPQPLVLTLATTPWCTSSWNSAIYSLWRLGADETSAKLLLSKRESANRGQHEPPITGSVGVEDVLIEFANHSLDNLRIIRTAIRHYSMKGDKATRVGPYALDPRNFVEEWLSTPAAESPAWSERELRAWHQIPENVSATFAYPMLHCPTQPDTWQVALDFEDKTSVYFLVRWKPPYQFSMVDISRQPRKECNEEVRSEQPYPAGTLFPAFSPR